ncbi:hypothetical protein, partial [uncultured Porphyromonas sp.]|uniref:hypothetical protein n=1 Tax=uncultured Porphyromonas sp. TaxID=159274 RepID=UPI0025E207D7
FSCFYSARPRANPKTSPLIMYLALPTIKSLFAQRGNDRILFGFICGLLSFWPFAMTLLTIGR